MGSQPLAATRQNLEQGNCFLLFFKTRENLDIRFSTGIFNSERARVRDAHHVYVDKWHGRGGARGAGRGAGYMKGFFFSSFFQLAQ